MRLLFLSLFFIATTAFTNAQSNGSIVGKIIDKEANDEPLAFANILIKGTTKGTTSDFDGLYEIDNVEPGTYTLSFSYLGYESIEIPNVIVESGKSTTINVSMTASEGMSLDEVVVTTTTKKDTESALLLDQKKAVEIKTAIGAQELARKGVSDVATAVTKTTGISKQEGSGSVFVRGLGDRYNMTTLNGLPLPSNNTAKKNIDLDIFSTDIVEFIGIDKTYTARNYGDYAGANIDISSRNYKGDGFLQLGAGIGGNTEALGQKDFYLNDGPNFTGFYTKSQPKFPLNNYNFRTSWDRTTAPTPTNSSISLKGGDSFQIGEESRLNFFAVASFDNDYTYREGISRANVTTSNIIRKDYDFISYNYNTNTTLMGNIGFAKNNNKISLNSLYVNTSSQSQEEYTGVVDAFDNAPNGGAFAQRAEFERTSLFVNQLLGDHKFGEKIDLNWGISYNTILNTIPNRRQNIVTPENWDEPNGPKSFVQTLSAGDNNRFYGELNENEAAANISGTYKFKENTEEAKFDGKLTLGYSGRIKDVAFEATQFNFRINRRDQNNNLIDQPIVEDVHNLDAYFNQENLNNGLFSIVTFRGGLGVPGVLDPQTYDGTQDIHAGFTNLEYSFSPKFTIFAGIRGEKINQTITWSTAIDPVGDTSKFDTFQVLPSLSLKYELNEKQNLKFAASKTYTLPQFKERALFLFEEVTQSTIGNPALYASTDYNVDFKWELFPKSTELISVGAFGKYIQNPINDVTINSASNDISYVNSGDWAHVLGAELEVRKDLFKKEVETEDSFLTNSLSVGLNASYMYTNQELNGAKVAEETAAFDVLPLSANFTNEEGRLTGASDLLLNGDISFFKQFSSDRDLQATLAYNYFSDRVYAIGINGKGDLIDQPVSSLDFILKMNLNKRIGLGLSAKNITNPMIERIQDVQDVVVQSYRKGSQFKLSLSYNF
ncbi:TonB-dependent receptor [Cellulophaga tyrosinoxydans]|uniref:Outer membrane receptor proteins, mostly Fe transport n=1 Tax=Cellulophaga tyrosinoxydans TaxID=504486 RepID=A0A1W1Z772_9FLAO|nr:TonB-dependent receptor [Cellulophaga tyrosinoxydans]SMC44263.1 Outer membrane receptor proteins, mostly Fe transport [Cellulophaga tyrosinoxydans]